MKRLLSGALVLTLLLGAAAPVAAQGTRPSTETKPFIFPVSGPSSPSTWILGQPYGNTTGAFFSGAANYSAGQYLHFGVDIGMACGTPVVAVADGVVGSVDNPYRGSAPHNLTLNFPELGLSVLYGHLLERPSLVEGQPVSQGDFVALSGDPDETCYGRPHLHLEVRALDQSVAYNPIHFIEAPWHSLVGVDSRAGSPFQRDLFFPRRWMSLEDQPDVAFGGRRLNDYAQTWPPPFSRRVTEPTLPDRPFTPVSRTWTLRQIGNGSCCAGAWWDRAGGRRLAFIDGVPGELAGVFEVALDEPLQAVRRYNAPPPITSADGTHEIVYGEDATLVRRLADGAEWRFAVPDAYPVLSPDNRLLLWTQGDAVREVRVAALDGSDERLVWSGPGRSPSARWLDSGHVLIGQREPDPSRSTTLTVVGLEDGIAYTLGTWHNLRNMQIAPGGQRLIFVSAFNPDPALDGTYALEIAPGARPEKLPWFGDYRWRDAESVYTITYDPATDIQQLHFYHVPTGESFPLTDPATQPFTIANGDWSVSPDGREILFQEARDGNLWLLTPGG